MLLRKKIQPKVFIIVVACVVIFFGLHLFNTYCLQSSISRYKFLHKHLKTDEPSSTKIVLFWTTFFDIPLWRMKKKTYLDSDLKSLGCRHTNCVFTHRKDFLESSHDYDAIIYHGAEIWNFLDLPTTRSEHQVYIMASLESPGEVKHSLKGDHDFYNLTMTYRLDSDIGWFYGQTVNLESGNVVAPSTKVKWRVPDNDFYDNEIYEIIKHKTRTAAWFVSHCDVHSKRDKLTLELQKFIDVDVYGKCGNLSCPRASHSACNEMLTTTYRFYFAFENTLCVDYVTEKLFNVMDNYVVPIIYSGAEITRFIPPKSYIDVNDFETVKDLADHLIYLSRNPREYAKYFWWKKHYKIVTPGLPFCEICEKINEFNLDNKRQVYGDIEKWFYQGACNKPNIKF